MTVEPSKLANWLTLARQGDDSARNHLFEACRSFVCVMARMQLHRRLQGKVDPSDVVQQSLLEAHCALNEFSGETPQEWLAWLKQIVKHNVIDTDKHYRGAEMRDLRKEQSMVALTPSGTEFSPVIADPGPSPSKLLFDAERELKLADAIEALPDDYRQVVILRNLERLPFENVAERMKRSRGACQMLWMRAVEMLKTQLTNETSI